MLQKKSVLCSAAAVLALAIGCSKTPTTPVAPAAPTDAGTGAAADGSTLKIGTPTPVSPVGGVQVTELTFTASKATGKFADITPSYQFQIRSGSTVVYDSGVTGGSGSGANVSHTATATIDPDTNFTWRVRAVFQGASGSWSSDASFKSPVGAYLRNGEVRDPLAIGRTVGRANGNVTFSAEGATLNDQTSNIQYVMDQTVQQGEFSFLAKNIKSAAPGGKSKMMAIQEGFGDITDDDYRFTVEKRGSGYVEPGQVRYRIITGDSSPTAGQIFDGGASTINFDTARWYFWRMAWRTGQATVTVRLDSETGPVLYNQSVGTGTHPYRPTPMVAYVGAPAGRAGPDDATVPRITVKNVWLSANPRPTFPN